MRSLSTKYDRVFLFVLLLSSFLMVALLCVFGGRIPVNAESVQSDVNVEVDSVLELSLQTCNSSDSSLVEIDVTPSTVGAFKSNCQTATVKTNAPGYALTTKALSSTLDYLNPTTVSPPPTIPSTSNTTSSPTTLSNDTWGFATENRLNFSPTYTIDNASNTYAALPTTDTTIYSTTTFPLPETSHKFFYAAKLTPATMAGSYATTVTYTAVGAEPEELVEEIFKFTIDTTLTSTYDTDPTHYDGTATTFAIPTSGAVGVDLEAGAYPAISYDWIVNCGGGQTDRVVTGTSDADSEGILCEYDTIGIYQISIRPNGTATMGWLDAYGSYNIDGGGGANGYDNLALIKSIDTPLTNSSRTQGANARFAFMFSAASNLTISADLLSQINTSQDTNFDYMFTGTFKGVSAAVRTATIPSGLFDTIDTSNAESISYMFAMTFPGFGGCSPSGTIPSGLFDSINTSKATDLSNAFTGTFIEAFVCYSDSEQYTFSSSATIPNNLFNSIDTSSATNVTDIFYSTFYKFAANHLDGTDNTDINSIWGNADLSCITAENADGVFGETFYNMRSLTGSAQTFIDTKLGGMTPDSATAAFYGTGVTDLGDLHMNWSQRF